MLNHALGKHSSIDILNQSLHEWQNIQKKELAILRAELLHDDEVQQLFDGANAAWEEYHAAMCRMNTAYCLCTWGGEDCMMSIRMLAHRVQWLCILREMSTAQL